MLVIGGKSPWHSLKNSRLGGHAFIATQSDESSAAAEHHFYHRCGLGADTATSKF